MANRVLIVLEDVALVACVEPMLREAGLDPAIVTDPGSAGSRGADRRVSVVVVQSKYAGGQRGVDLLRGVAAMRGGPLPSVLISDRPLSDTERARMRKKLVVQEFLSDEPSPEDVTAAVRRAVGIDLDIEITTDPEMITDPFDFLVESQQDLEPTRSDPHAAVTKAVKIDTGVGAVADDPDGEPLAQLPDLDLDPGSAFPELDQDPASAVPELPELVLDPDSELAELPELDLDPDLAAAESLDAGAVTEFPEYNRSAAVELPELELEIEAEIESRPDPAPASRAEPGEQHTPPTADETAIDINLLTLGLAAEMKAARKAEQAAERQEDMAQIEELKKQLVLERRSREKAELELQRASKEFSDKEHELRAQHRELQKALDDANSKLGTDTQDRSKVQKLEQELRELRRSKDAYEKKIKHLEDERRKSDGRPRSRDAALLGEDREPPPAEGRFEQVPYPRLLARLLHHEFTGAVAIRAGQARREIFFDNGQPVAAASASPGEHIGRILVEQGRISEEQYLKAARRMVEHGVRLTEALLEMGYIDDKCLTEEQRFIVRDQIVCGFATQGGSFSLDGDAKLPEGNDRFDFEPGEIFAIGYRQYAPDGEVDALYETLRTSYLLVSTELARFRTHLGLEAEEERLLGLFGQAYTLEEAVDRAKISPDRAARIIGALRGLGLISTWQPTASHFEDRLRQMEQEHRAAQLEIREDMYRREERLIQAFERVLAGLENEVRPADGVDRFRAELSDPGIPLPASPPPDSDEQPSTMELELEAEIEPAAELESNQGEPRVDAASAFTGEMVEEINPDLLQFQMQKEADQQENPLSREPTLTSTAEPGFAAHQPEPEHPELDPDAISPFDPTSDLDSERDADDELSSALDSAFIPPIDSVGRAGASKVDDEMPGIDAIEPTAITSPGEEKYQEGLRFAAQALYDEAEVALREAVRFDAHNASYLGALARILLSNPKYDRAGTLPIVRSLLDRAQSIAPEDQDVRAMLAKVASEQTQLNS